MMKYLFTVTMKAGYRAEEYAEAWVEVSRIIQQTAGAQGTYLHRDLNDPGRLLAIAHWTSKAARDRIPDNETVSAILRATKPKCDVQFIGEFDEPEWQVLPGIS